MLLFILFLVFIASMSRGFFFRPWGMYRRHWGFGPGMGGMWMGHHHGPGMGPDMFDGPGHHGPGMGPDMFGGPGHHGPGMGPDMFGGPGHHGPGGPGGPGMF